MEVIEVLGVVRVELLIPEDLTVIIKPGLLLSLYPEALGRRMEGDLPSLPIILGLTGYIHPATTASFRSMEDITLLHIASIRGNRGYLILTFYISGGILLE